MRLSFCVMALCGTALHQVRAQGVELGYGVSGIRVIVDPKTDGTPSLSGRLRFTLQNLRLGVVATP